MTVLAAGYMKEKGMPDEYGYNTFDDGSCWDEETFEGDAYRGYAWIANVIEVEVDTDTYEVSAEKVFAAAEAASCKPCSSRTAAGGMLQAGWSHLEDMRVDDKGGYTASHERLSCPDGLDTPEWEIELLEDPCAGDASAQKHRRLP